MLLVELLSTFENFSLICAQAIPSISINGFSGWKEGENNKGKKIIN